MKKQYLLMIILFLIGTLGVVKDNVEVRAVPDQSYQRLQVFADVIAALESDDQDALRQSLVEIEEVQQNILNRNVEIGARQNTLDLNESVLMQRADAMRRDRSQVEDADIVEVATQLSFAEHTYAAALAASANLYQLSLLNFL